MLDSRFVSHLSLHLAHAGFNLAEAQPVLIADGYVMGTLGNVMQLAI